METYSLSHLPAGNSGIITAVATPASSDNQIIRRLNELGFLPGEQVTLLRRGPGGKEPLAVQVGDTIFALRQIEADCIQIDSILEKAAA